LSIFLFSSFPFLGTPNGNYSTTGSARARRANYFRNLGVRKDLVEDLADIYREALGYSAEEIEHTGDRNLEGLFGELQIIKRHAPEVVEVHYRIKIDGKMHEIDILRRKRIVESKYWPSEETYKMHLEDPQGFARFIEQLKLHKKAMDMLRLEGVDLVFGREGVISEAKFMEYAQKIKDALGGETSWLKIYYGSLVG